RLHLRRPAGARLPACRPGRALWRADGGDEPAARGGISQDRPGRARDGRRVASAARPRRAMSFVAGPPLHETVGSDPLRRIGWRDGLLWGVALLTVLFVQAVGAFVLSTWREEPPAPGAPPPAIMIELAEIAVAPQVEDIAAEDG